MAHPNEDLLRRGYEAFSKGDLDTVRKLFSPDIQWHVPGRNPVAGDYKGIEEVMQFLGKIMEGTGGTFGLEVHDILANDEHGVVLVRTSGQRDGKSLSGRDVHLFHIEGGKVTEYWAHPGDQHAIDEFWA